MICKVCGVDQPETNFGFHRKATNTRRTECKECGKVYARARYASNAAVRLKLREVNKRSITRNLNFARETLISSGCVDCGTKDVRVLEFDHVTGDKITGVMQLARAAVSVAKLENEIAKCVVRCLNCHRIVTYDRAGWLY
jgi:uncharacterized Zn finger protein